MSLRDRQGGASSIQRLFFSRIFQNLALWGKDLSKLPVTGLVNTSQKQLANEPPLKLMTSADGGKRRGGEHKAEDKCPSDGGCPGLRPPPHPANLPHRQIFFPQGARVGGAPAGGGALAPSTCCSPSPSSGDQFWSSASWAACFLKPVLVTERQIVVLRHSVSLGSTPALPTRKPSPDPRDSLGMGSPKGIWGL